MNRATLAALFVCLAIPAAASAEESNPLARFHTHGGVAFAFAPGSPNAYGIGAVAEPVFSIFDQLRVGLRADGEVLVGLDIGGSNVYAGLHILAGALPKIEFDLLGGDIRPFVGFGAGVYTVVVLGGGTGGATAIAGTGFGVMPQLGINFGGFRIAAQYHAVLTGPGAAANAFALELSGTFFGI
ncbi:MAG TPA: hypothetical protein VFA20_00725 [Myxococcaceae bacterium]|nr:hypothetical protein [Myxococcaceae bacterium]